MHSQPQSRFSLPAAEQAARWLWWLAFLVWSSVLAMLLLLGALFPLTAQAQTDEPCEPPRVAAAGNAWSVESVWHLDGAAVAWWCPATRNADGSVATWYAYRFGGLFTYGSPSTLTAALARIYAAADKPAQMRLEITAATKLPAAGSVDECREREVRREACAELVTKPLGPPYPAALPPDWCGAPVDCSALPPPPETWKAVGGTVYMVVNGTVGAATTKQAPAGAAVACNALHITRKVAGSAQDFCPLASPAPTNEVTRVQRAP